jgi:RHS repeat-associated protein
VSTSYYYLGGQLVAQSVGSSYTTTYIHKDSLGSKSVVSNYLGASIASMKYLPFGLGRTTPDQLGTTKEFTGQRLDSTGLYYYNARYYDPAIGRFISPDNNTSQPFNPQNLNRYSYCLNNPLKYTDPSGNDQVITDIGENDNGEICYSISDGQGNLLAIATGIDELAQKMNDCDSVSRGVDLPLGQAAADYIKEAGLSSGNQVIQPSDPAPSKDTSRTNPIERVAQVIFDTVGQVKSAPNTILGLSLGAISGGSPTLGPGGTIIFYNVNPNSITGKLEKSLHAEAFTIGYVILSGDTQLSPNLLTHELGHVTQSAILGPLYLPAYGVCTLAAGGNWNKNIMEVGPFHPNWPSR